MFKACERAKNARRSKKLTHCQYFIALWKRIFLAVQYVEDRKNKTIILKAHESTRHAKKKHLPSILEIFRKDEFYRNSQIAIWWTEEHCKYVDSLMPIDFCFSVTRKERLRCENNYTLGVNDQVPKPGPMKKRTGYQQAVHKVLVMRKQVENPNPYVPNHVYESDSDRSKNRQRLEQQWRRWGWVSWSELSSSSSSATWWLASTEKPAWWSSEDWQEQ